MITEANVSDAFRKVVSHLALTARDMNNATTSAALMSNQLAQRSKITEVPHPFVCEKGYVRNDLSPNIDLSIMVREVTICYAHTYEDLRPKPGECCRLHPVVDDGQLAAYALGGPEAVATSETTRQRHGFDPKVFDAWSRFMASFALAVREHDRKLDALLSGPRDPTLNVAAIERLPPLDGPYPLGPTTIKIRPNEWRGKGRRKSTG